MRIINEIVEEFKSIKQDYAWNPDIMCKDDERVSKIKEIIDTRLSLADKTIILLYVDCLSLRKMGEKLHLSHMTCMKEVNRIKKKILAEYKRDEVLNH